MLHGETFIRYMRYHVVRIKFVKVLYSPYSLHTYLFQVLKTSSIEVSQVQSHAFSNLMKPFDEFDEFHFKSVIKIMKSLKWLFCNLNMKFVSFRIYHTNILFMLKIKWKDFTPSRLWKPRMMPPHHWRVELWICLIEYADIN